MVVVERQVLWVLRSGNWYDFGGASIVLVVVERQLVWFWWGGNWIGCGGAAIGMGVFGEEEGS